MTSKITRERLQEIAEDGFLKHGESKVLARMALAAMDSEPVAWTWHYREQWHVTNDKCRAEFVAKDGDVAVLPLYRHAQSAQISEPVLPLQDKDLQGVIDALEHPAGINAAGKQVVRHALVEIQERRKADSEPDYDIHRDANRYRFLRDKDAFGDEGSPGLAGWDDLAELDMGEFDSAVDARINDSGIALYSIERLPTEGADADIYAELYRLRSEIKGPDGFDTWRDAAIAEKKARVELEKQINQSGRDIDYLGAMAAFHSDKWHKMDPITGYMHGWNARRNHAQQPVVPDENTLRIQGIEALETFLTVTTPEPEMVGGIKLTMACCRVLKAIIKNNGWADFNGGKPEKVKAETIISALREPHSDACRAAMLAAAPQPQNAPQNIPEIIPGWIPVSERMPEEGQHIIIFCDGAFVLSAQCRDGEFFDVVRDGEEFFETVSRCVTHWQPLPAGPKEEK